MRQDDMFDSIEETLRKERDFIDNEIKGLNIKRKLIHEELRNTCQHESKYVEDKKDYTSGSYLDCAYTDRWKECSLCGAKWDKTCESHAGRYG